MLVKALSTGYYQNRRQKEGDVFQLVDIKHKVKKEEKAKDGKKTIVFVDAVLKAKDQFSEKWMEQVEEDDVPKEKLEHAEAVSREVI